MDDLLKQLQTEGHALEEELIFLRRSLHQYPETGWAEFQTSKTLQRHLTDAGLPTPGGIAGTGFYLDITGKEDGPLIADGVYPYPSSAGKSAACPTPCQFCRTIAF